LTQQPQQKIELDLVAPHSDTQGIIMDAFNLPGIQEVFVACGTKFGKSISGSVAMSKKIYSQSDGKFRWLAPIYRQTRLGMEYMQKVLAPRPHSELLESKMQISLPYLNSTLEFWHTQDPVSLEGAGVHALIGDEAAKMSYDAYISSRTTLTFTKGPSMWLSTPLGKNWFYTKFSEAKEEMEWAQKRGRSPTRLAIHAPSSTNPYISREVIEQARRDLPDRLFRQYYLAEFIDDGSVFIGVGECVVGPEVHTDTQQQYWVDCEANTSEVVIGVDWAKTHDRTVFWAIDVPSRTCVGFQRFYKTPYTEAIRKLVQFSKKFKDVITIRHDKTGLGGVIDDYMAETGLPYEGVTLTNATKADLVAKLITSFEQKDMFIPNWREALSELGSFEVQTSPTGLMSYGAVEGKHDDIVIAMALAYSGLLMYGDRDYTVKLVGEPPVNNVKVDEDDDDNTVVSATERFYQIGRAHV
jgi:hypothetical protein